MAPKRIILTLTAFAVLGLTACTDYQSVNMETLKDNGEYWQRANVTEATYMEGPKAQQMLHRDISRCVTELRELVRLGAIRQATPGNTTFDGEVPDVSTPQGQLSQWDTPEHDGALLAEQSNYDDFETCMQAKGWERMEHVPYDVAQKSRETYLEAIMGEHYHSSVSDDPVTAAPKVKGPYDNLNQ